MKVLICWAGSRSHQIAVALREWLPSVLQHVDPWVSSEDIEKGAVGLPELLRQLEAADFGIICLVPENLVEPWIHFEAGALFKSIEGSRISPLLFGVEFDDVSAPLALFQATRFEKEEVRKLIHSINNSSSKSIERDRVDKTFNACWPDLERNLSTMPEVQEGSTRELAPEAVVTELHEKQREILILLAEDPHEDYADVSIAHVIGENVTRTKYHLEQLIGQGFVRSVSHTLSEETYELTQAGRAFAVEHGLI